MRGREEKEKEDQRVGRGGKKVALITISYPSTAGGSTVANSGNDLLKYITLLVSLADSKKT